jgi:tryptophan synthase alpha chain
MTGADGVERIREVFHQAHCAERAALMPYLPLGFPTPERSLELAESAVAAGADMLELGVPFSDPLADGPTIQHATQVALEQGISLPRCLDIVRVLRDRGITTPFLLMGYVNPILAYGQAAFCRDCREAGGDGLIVPDLPPEEGGTLERICRANGLALVYLLAPTSPPERIKLVTARSTGFVYLVSVTGTTGAREGLPDDLADFVARVRSVTDKPLAVGFGISTQKQAGQVAALADGVIVGSALVKRAGRPDAIAAVHQFVRELRLAVAPGSRRH